MQVNCPQCTTRIQIDDAKVPERAFKVRCPKCQAILSLAGRGSETEDPAATGPLPQTTPPVGAPPPAEAPPPMPSAEALERRERLAESHNDALVALAGAAGPQVQQALARLGFNVDAVDDIEEGARLVEQGAYEVAVTSRAVAEAGLSETLAQRIQRMPPDSRRRVFVVLIGDEFRSGDGTQAWTVQADLVLNTADATRCETLIRATLAERKRLYQPFLDARRRIESE